MGAAAAAHGDACVHAVLGIIGIAGLRPAGIRHRADMPPVGHIRGGGGHIGDSLQYPLFPLRGCVGGGNRCNGSVKAVSRHAQRFAGICLAGDPVGSVTVFGEAEFLIVASVLAKLPYRFISIYQGSRHLKHLIVIGAGMNVKPSVLPRNSFQCVSLILPAVIIILVDQGIIRRGYLLNIKIFSRQPGADRNGIPILGRGGNCNVRILKIPKLVPWRTHSLFLKPQKLNFQSIRPSAPTPYWERAWV